MKNKWDPAQVEKVDTGLSAGMPLTAGLSSYPHPTRERLDMHYALEMGVVIEGRMKRLYKDLEVNLERGGAWMCGMWEPHGCRIVEAPCSALVVVMLPGILAETAFPAWPEVDLMAPFLARPVERPSVAPERIPAVLKAAEHVLDMLPSPARIAAPRIYLRSIELILVFVEGWEFPASGCSGPLQRRFSRLSPVIELVFRERRLVTVSEASAVCGMSRNRFAELFRGLMGLSFPEFALRHRVSGVAKDLLSSDAPLKALALKWGFCDAAHLSRCFRRYYKCTPGELRGHNCSVERMPSVCGKRRDSGTDCQTSE